MLLYEFLSRHFVILLFFCCFCGFSQYQHRNISVANGLPQSEVNDAVQDALGYLWFATQGGGITQFDGENFKIFQLNDGLPSNFINSLLVQNDSLLIGSNKGLTIKYKKHFTTYKSPKVNKIDFFNKQLFLATTEGVHVLRKGAIIPLKINLQIDIAIVHTIVFHKGFYWIATNKGLWKVDQLIHPKNIKKITTQNFTALLSNKNQLIALNETGAIVVLEKNTIKEILKSIKETTNLQEVNPGELWISTKNNGITIVSLQEYSLIKKIDSYGFKKTPIQKIVKDRQQNYWAITAGNGFYKINASPFSHYNFGSKITALHKKNGTIWFGNQNKEIFKIDRNGTEKINVQNHLFTPTSLTTDRKGNLWIGSEKNGIYIYRNHKNNFSQKTVSTIERLYSENGFPSDNIQEIHIQDQTIWVITQTSGIVKLHYDFKKGIVKKITRFNTYNGLKDTSINESMLYNKQLWYVTKNGDLGNIYKDKITHFSKILGNKVSLTSFVFLDNTIILGTLEKGLWQTNFPELNEFKPIKKGNLLTSNTVYQLLIDTYKNLWVGSEKGLDKVILKNNQIVHCTHFNKNDGFIGVETSLNTSIEDSFGNLWFGTRNGLTKYSSTELDTTNITPEICFEAIEIAYQDLDSIHPKFKNGIAQLKPEQNNISFSYKTLDLNHPKRIEYRWKLRTKFSPWSTNTSINFAKLNAGDYLFSVQSRNSKKQKSAIIIFPFFIDKPFYQKLWFIGAITFILFLGFALWIYDYNQKVKLKVEKLELKNHLIILEQKGLQLQMNPHFIFNVLNGIKALGNKGNTRELNTTISRFSKLLRATLHNSKKEEISLSEESETLKNYLELEQQLSSKKFEFKIFTTTNPINEEEILIPPMLLQPFIENSIKHGISKNGKITIIFSLVNDFLHCSVTDNGIGFTQNQKKKRTLPHQSIAIEVTRERIENLSKNSNFSIKELKKEGTVTGTKVEFKIPLKTDF